MVRQPLSRRKLLTGLGAALAAGVVAVARPARETRARKERRTQLTEKQRRRRAVRTTQLNFRCSPEFKERTTRLARQLDQSIADVMEMAIEELARAKGLEAGRDNG